MSTPDATLTDLVLFEKKDGVAWITMNREAKLNAMNSEMNRAFLSYLETIAQDPEIRVGVITGKGRAFIAGADIGEYREQDFRAFVAYQRFARRILALIEGNPKPIIAAVNGYALGGGFEIALACDMILASENAQLGLPEVKLGLLPGGGGTQRLSRLIGRQRAKEMLMTGKRITAAQAESWGIVNAVTPPDELLAEAERLAKEIAAQAPLAVEGAKRLVNEGLETPLEPALSYEHQMLFTLYRTEDGQEGIRAFTEKREPRWKGE